MKVEHTNTKIQEFNDLDVGDVFTINGVTGVYYLKIDNGGTENTFNLTENRKCFVFGNEDVIKLKAKVVIE